MAITTKETLENDRLKQFEKELRINKQVIQRMKDEQQRKRPVHLTNLFPGLRTKK